MAAAADKSSTNIANYLGDKFREGASESDLLNGIIQLRSEGVDLNATNSDGETALHIAAAAGLVSVVNDLLAAGADPNKLDNSGMDPFVSAIRTLHPKAPEIVGLFIRTGKVDINRRTSCGSMCDWTPLHHAVQWWNNINTSSASPCPMHRVADQGTLFAERAVIAQLLAAGASALARTADGELPRDLLSTPTERTIKDYAKDLAETPKEETEKRADLLRRVRLEKVRKVLQDAEAGLTAASASHVSLPFAGTGGGGSGGAGAAAATP